MNNYKKILVAIDINAQYENIIQKALALSESTKDVNLVYIPLPSVYIQPYLYGMAYNAVDDSERMTRAHKSLEEIGEKFGISKSHIFFKTGVPADEIKQFADDIDADLIVIGTHGQSGFKLLLGSTANAVLHGVKRDVLAIRVYEDN